MAIESYILWDRVGKVVVTLPGVSEKLCFNTPSFYTGKKFFVRLKEDGETIALYNNERDNWIASDPDTFFITDHYKNYPILLVDLKRVSMQDLNDLVVNSWKLRASKKISNNI